ncbi:histidine kinase [Aureimonas glaciei]|uniref:Histidine kinase n=2 Tax=Aureimonas glaciei TaxID=1776957 RepID=A0A917DHI3_9HYPH|nr:histidine kinase [Aureimonas glaciei]
MLTARDVMTTEVVTVGPQDTVKNVALLMTTYGISAVPVVDDGGLIGIVSEGDLLHRDELGTCGHHRSWWLELLTGNAALAAEYIKSHAQHVADVMTDRVFTTTPDTPVAEIAEILETKRVKRLPVMKDGKVVGIVSRANLVSAIAKAQRPLVGAANDDVGIRSRILQELRMEPWSTARAGDVAVEDGIVLLRGYYNSVAERDACHVLIENVDGVRRIEDQRSMLVLPLSEYPAI